MKYIVGIMADMLLVQGAETAPQQNACETLVTPNVYNFDKDIKLRKEGRIDEDHRESLLKKQDARAALDAMIAGNPVHVPHTPAFGCSTKWKSKIDSQLREMKRIEA